MTKQTTHELQAIVDGAPEGATCHASFVKSNLNTYAKKWGGEYKFWDESSNTWTYDGWKQSSSKANFQSLDDIREIIELRKEVERLEKRLSNICDTCHGVGMVGNILDSMDCPECSRKETIYSLEMQAKGIEDAIESVLGEPQSLTSDALSIRYEFLDRLNQLRQQAKELK